MMPQLSKDHLAVAGAALLHAATTSAIPCTPAGDPFEVVDPQNWVNMDDMTWDDYVPVPNTNWKDPAVTGSERNFNIALVTVDYPNMPFVVTQPENSTIFNNPQPAASSLDRGDVPAFYRDLLNKPSDINRGHTLHEYWMEDSAGRFGVDLTVFGAYEMPAHSWQYGVENRMNPGECPVAGGDDDDDEEEEDRPCNLNIRTDALGAWRADVGDETAASYELVFILSAGQDESGTWQEFGPMRWASRDEVPDEFGPPLGNGTNYARTRYVDWTSWASASTIWPNAGSGSSTQAESSGMGVYAHELSHLLSIADNYNNPYSDPPQRAYTGPFSMMSRGSFLGPGGPHTRWQIPALEGASLGSLHTVRDKLRIGLADWSDVVNISRSDLAASGAVLVADVTARAVAPASVEDGLIGLRVILDGDGDLAPSCDPEESAFCEGGPYDFYDVEVVDRMGADSFQADAGVMFSKGKTVDNFPFQWTVDANPQDIEMVDFVRPDGTAEYVTIGDFRQLSDALFHAGTRSGSEFEHVDGENGLHFYVFDIHRDDDGVLSYTVGVRAAGGEGGDYGVEVPSGMVTDLKHNKPTEKGVTCSFEVTNVGSFSGDGDLDGHLDYDVFRLDAEVEGDGWVVVLPHEIKAIKFGETGIVHVAVAAAEDNADDEAVVTLTATSELGDVTASGECKVSKE